MFLNRYIIFFFSITASFIFGAAVFMLHNPIVDFSSLENYDPGVPSVLLDDQGNEWARFQVDRRQFVHLNDMSKHIINAFISAEDHAFFNHQGISFRGIIRSILVNLWKGRRAQGASTITQQLIRLLFLMQRKHLFVKLKNRFSLFLLSDNLVKNIF